MQEIVKNYVILSHLSLDKLFSLFLLLLSLDHNRKIFLSCLCVANEIDLDDDVKKKKCVL